MHPRPSGPGRIQGTFVENFSTRKLLALLPLILLCYISFAIACVVSIFLIPVSLVFKEFKYARRVLLAQDRVLASVMGFDGTSTVSRECGLLASSGRCGWCCLLCKLLNLLDPGHCERAAT